MSVYRFGPLAFDPLEGRLEHRPTAQHRTLRPQVARLLQAFVERPQELIDRQTLCKAVWDEGVVVDFETGLAAVLRELRAELRAAGGAQTLIETVPRRGYRLASEVVIEDDATAPSAQRQWQFVAVGASLLAVVMAVFAWQQNLAPDSLDPAGRTLAVLPFSQFGTPAPGAGQMDLLLADLMLVELWEHRPDGLALVGRASLIPYADRDNVATLVARDLGVDLLLEGSVVFDGPVVDVSSRLLQMPGGRILWSDSRSYPSDGMPPGGEIAAEMVGSLMRAWPPQSPADSL